MPRARKPQVSRRKHHTAAPRKARKPPSLRAINRRWSDESDEFMRLVRLNTLRLTGKPTV